VFKPLKKVELKLKEGEKRDIRVEDEEVVTKKIEPSLREYNDFLPMDFNFTLEKLRTNSRDRFKRLGIIPFLFPPYLITGKAQYIVHYFI